MRNTYEFVDHDERLPVKVFLHDVVRTPRHWHEDVEILFVLKGSVRVILGAGEVVVPEKGLCVVNSHQVHDTEALEDNLVLALQLDPDFIEERSPGFKALRFTPRPFEGRPEGEADEMRRAIAEIMNAVSRKGRGYLALAYQWIFRVVFLLESACVDPGMKPTLVDAEDTRLRRIIDFIEERSAEEIKLGDLASFANLNPQYLSRYFSGHMGVTLSRYIASIRARNALTLLERGNKPVTDIALECGFPNLKAFYAAFKENFGKTPRDYVRALPGEGSGHGQGSGGPGGQVQPGKGTRVFDYLAIDPSTSLSLLYEYLGKGAPLVEPRGLERRAVLVDPAAPAPGPALGEARIAAFGRAAEGLRAGWREQFRAYQREIGCDYVRFHGILSDEMLVASRLADGSLSFDFHLVDELLDFILGCGARPFLELGFMPRALAREDRTLLRWKANVSPPAGLGEWSALVSALTRHLVGRYGAAEVEAWPFEVWNEPELTGIFWGGSREEFFALFSATRDAVKAVDPAIAVGGCGITHWSILHDDWLADFEAWCVSRDALPDFVSWHVYPLEPLGLGEACDIAAYAGEWARVLESGWEGSGFLLGGPSDVAEVMAKVGARLDSGPFAALPRYVTEWNSSPNSRDLVHDTAFMGPFIAAGLSASAGLSRGMAWWVFSDIFEEFGAGEGEFHGGFGLCTRQGIPKASWQAYRLWSMLSGRVGTGAGAADDGGLVIGRGEGWVATRPARPRAGSPLFRVLLYNYCHYDAAYGRLDASRISRHSRYEVFERGSAVEFLVEVQGLRGEARVVARRVGRERGSVFDEWLRMGCPDLVPGAEGNALLEALKKASEPAIRVDQVACEGGKFRHGLRLEPHDLVLLEVHAPVPPVEN